MEVWSITIRCDEPVPSFEAHRHEPTYCVQELFGANGTVKKSLDMLLFDTLQASRQS